jgi:hypothetical protein
MADQVPIRIRQQSHEPELPFRRRFCCFAVFYQAPGLSRHVAENAENEQV